MNGLPPSLPSLTLGRIKPGNDSSTKSLFPTTGSTLPDSKNNCLQVISEYINTKNYLAALMLCVSASDNNNDLAAAALISSVITKAQRTGDLLMLHSICVEAQSTSIASKYALGLIYLNGYGPGTKEEKDQLAVACFQETVDKGYVAGQVNLGWMYSVGCGVPNSDVRAAGLFQLAANQGNDTAQYNLGKMYADGRGVLKNHSEAVRLYKLAADQGNAAAQNNLGRMYSHGLGVLKNHSEAVRLYKLAADQGNATAQNNLGRMYANGFGVPKNAVKAACLFQLAAGQGHAKAKNNLELLYKQGLGKVNPETEDVYHNAMKELGVPENLSLFLLGMLYLEGKGVDKQSHSQARKHLSAAEALEHPSAAFYLGESYRTAGFWSARQDFTEAKRCYIRAAQSGDKQVEARSVLKEFYPKDKTIYLTAPPPNRDQLKNVTTLYDNL